MAYGGSSQRPSSYENGDRPPMKGEAVIYHVGHLSVEARKDPEVMVKAHKFLGLAGYKWARDGRWSKHSNNYDDYSWVKTGPAKVDLFQRRCARGFEYIAVGR